LFPSPFSSLFISYLTLKGRNWRSRKREIMKITKVGLTWVTSKERSPVTMVGVWVRILSRGGFCLLVDDVHHALFLRFSSSFTSGTNKHREVTSRHVHCGTASWTRHRPANRSLETFCPPQTSAVLFTLLCSRTFFLSFFFSPISTPHPTNFSSLHLP